MKAPGLLLGGVILVGVCFLAGAQSSFIPDIPDWDNAVFMEVVASQEPVRPGDEIQIAILIDVKPGYHLYGPKEKPPSRTEVHVEGELRPLGEPVFPPAVKRDLSGLGEFDLYEGSIAIKIPVAVPQDAEVGSELDAKVFVKYQICTEQACSAPTSDTLVYPLPVRAPGSPVQSVLPDIFGADTQ